MWLSCSMSITNKPWLVWEVSYSGVLLATEISVSARIPSLHRMFKDGYCSLKTWHIAYSLQIGISSVYVKTKQIFHFVYSVYWNGLWKKIERCELHMVVAFAFHICGPLATNLRAQNWIGGDKILKIWHIHLSSNRAVETDCWCLKRRNVRVSDANWSNQIPENVWPKCMTHNNQEIIP